MTHRSLTLFLLALIAILACEPTALFSSATPTHPPDLIATDVVRQRAVAATLAAEAQAYATSTAHLTGHHTDRNANRNASKTDCDANAAPQSASQNALPSSTHSRRDDVPRARRV